MNYWIFGDRAYAQLANGTWFHVGTPDEVISRDFDGKKDALCLVLTAQKITRQKTLDGKVFRILQ